jgi:hypothetical protein
VSDVGIEIEKRSLILDIIAFVVLSNRPRLLDVVDDASNTSPPPKLLALFNDAGSIVSDASRHSEAQLFCSTRTVATAVVDF